MAAKETKPTSETPAQQEVAALAESLFSKHWQPGEQTLGKTQVAFAAMCFQGAQTFLKVASRIREGASPTDILEQPE